MQLGLPSYLSVMDLVVLSWENAILRLICPCQSVDSCHSARRESANSRAKLTGHDPWWLLSTSCLAAEFHEKPRDCHPAAERQTCSDGRVGEGQSVVWGFPACRVAQQVDVEKVSI
eukprot:6025370-Prymnesium_polylepis.3